MSYKMETVRTKEQFDELYANFAFTIEGLALDNIANMMKWLENIKAYEPNKDVATVYVIKGSIMNDVYELTGDNAYRKNLNIVSVLGIDLNPLIWARFQVGGKWFTDVVDNNRRRENEKMNK